MNLYAVHVSPLCYIAPFFAFEDDNHIIIINDNLERLIEDIETIIKSITKWLRESGLAVNETQACLYSGICSELVLFGCTRLHSVVLFLFKTGSSGLKIGHKSCFVVTQFSQK